MRIEDFDRKYVATEWDGGWFCYECDKLNHWKSKAFVYNDHKYCRECAQRMCDNDSKRDN